MIPAPLLGIGGFSSYEFLIHLQWNKDLGIACTEETMKKGITPSLDYIIEWTDINYPTLFTAGYVLRGLENEQEMTLLAIYLKPEVPGYRFLYETLAESKKLLDRSVSISGMKDEIVSRFQRLILE